MENIEGFLEELNKPRALKARPRTFAPTSSNTQRRLRIAQGSKSAVFKLISKGVGSKQLKKLLDYLSDPEKNEELKKIVHTESEVVHDIERLTEIKKEWLEDFSRNTRKNKIDFIHFTVSTPKGSDRDSTEKAALQFIRNTYPNHKFMAVRHDDTDHPHVHFILQYRDDRFKPLPIRKANLLDYRQKWALSCQEHGIDVVANYRYENGNTHVSKRIGVVKIQDRGGQSYIESSKEEDGHVTDPDLIKIQMSKLIEESISFYKDALAVENKLEAEDLKKQASKLWKKANSIGQGGLSDIERIEFYQKIHKRYGKATTNEIRSLGMSGRDDRSRGQ